MAELPDAHIKVIPDLSGFRKALADQLRELADAIEREER